MSVLVAFEDRQVWWAAPPWSVIVYSRGEHRLRCRSSRGLAIHKSITPEA
jgi:hypothetical protein